MQLYLQGSPLVEMTAKKSDGTILFIVETQPYLEDQRTEVYDAEGDVLGSIIWNGTQPSHICVYSESATQAQAFEMVPRGDPTAYVLFFSCLCYISHFVHRVPCTMCSLELWALGFGFVSH